MCASSMIRTGVRPRSAASPARTVQAWTARAAVPWTGLPPRSETAERIATVLPVPSLNLERSADSLLWPFPDPPGCWCPAWAAGAKDALLSAVPELELIMGCCPVDLGGGPRRVRLRGGRAGYRVLSG